jgi:DNA anti-recombination protein RmuC
VPLHVLTGEAVDVAAFFKRYYEPELAPRTGKRITLLVDEVQSAQTQYQLAADAPAGDEDVQRGRFVLSELTAALEFLFDDGVEDERDAQLARVRQANEDTSSTDALAGALAEYAGLAEAYRDELDGLGDFEAEMIDEAKELAAAIRDRSAQGTSDTGKKSAAALEWRNRLAGLLAQEVGRVRKAARFVFRHHPQIRREATSTYERRTRAARRRAAAKGEVAGDEAVE